MKLWDKGYTIHNLVDRYTVGDDRAWDKRLVPYDIQTNKAHAAMLCHIGLLTAAEHSALDTALDDLLADWQQGQWIITDEFEDIHSQIEHLLTERCGEAGKKIHTARSRNDQVLTDLHLYAKDQLKQLDEMLLALFNSLLHLADRYQGNLMPGYTHLQVAMPSSYGLWLSAFAESLVDDRILVQAALRIADQNPLGSAAGYGSSFPINRTLTTQLLGFATLRYNSLGAQLSRGRLEKATAYALSSLAGTLGKLASDMCLFMSQNFNLLSFPPELTTGSSIMPHKQNPDVWEIMRARCNTIQQLPAHLSMLTANLTSGYHRDFQELKGPFIHAVESSLDNLEVANFMLQYIQINQEAINSPMYDAMYTVEALHKKVQDGTPFRTAYRELSHQIAEGTYQPEKALHHSHEGSIGNLCLKEIEDKMKSAGGFQVS